MAYLGDDTMIFGSDSSATGASYMRKRMEEDMSMLREEVGVRQETIEKIFSTNAMKLIFRLFYCIKDEIELSFCHYDRNSYSYRTD
jgi:hypothetical protein